MPSGIVKERKANLAVVEIERQDMCGECHACEMLSSRKKCILTCKVQAECQEGDKVEIALGTSHFLQAVYTLYGIPLLGFLAGLGISGLLGKIIGMEKMDLLLAAGMLTGTIAGVFYIKMREKKQVYEKYLPKIVGKVKEQ